MTPLVSMPMFVPRIADPLRTSVPARISSTSDTVTWLVTSRPRKVLLRIAAVS
jgi:hypothetical protein